MNMRKVVNARILSFVALSSMCAFLAAHADTPAQLHAALGSPAGVTVLNTSDWAVGTDSGIGLGATYAKSTNGGVASSTSSLNVQVSGEGFLLFKYFVSSESNYDKLKLFVDGVEIKAWSGDENSSYVHHVTGSGKHSVSWQYGKDNGSDKGSDMAAVASVSWSDEYVLVIPASTTSIAASEYAGQQISRVEFEAGSKLTSVGANAFKNCTALKSIVFPEGLATIADGVFDGCSALVEISLPSTLESLGSVDVSTLTALAGTFGSGYWMLDGWVIGFKGACPSAIPDEDDVRGFAKGALENCQYIRSFAPVTRNLTGISDSAFRHCFNLEYVYLPDSLARIGARAFEGCTQLAEVAIPGSVNAIGNYAFRYCYGLMDLYLASGVQSIGEQAFYDDYLLMEVDIPASASSIGDQAFGGDSSLIRVGVRGDLKKLSAIFSNYAFIREVTVKDGPGTLLTGLFEGCSELEDVRFLATAAPKLESSSSSPFTDKVPQTLTVYVPSGSTGWVGIDGAPGLPQAWPKNSSAQRRAIAYWDVPTYLVEFDSNGGSLGVQPTYQKPETTFRLPPEPTQSGYHFTGWWTSPIEGWEVTDKTVFIEGTYTRLYAHWASGHRIFLNANGGMVTNSATVLVEQSFYGALPAPVRTGYAFGGWTYQGETVVPGMQILVDADHTLTAEWNALTYSVHYNPNGGKGDVTAQQFKYDTLQSLDKCRFTKEDFVFDGWSTTPAGAAVYSDCQLVKNLAALQGVVVNLYAKWRPVKHTVTLVKNNGSANTTFKVMEGKNYNADLHTWIPARAGFTFGGWWTAVEGGEAIYSSKGYAISNTRYWDAQRRWKGTGDVTLYARWNPLKYTVTLVKYNATADSTFQVMFDRSFNSDIGGWIPVRSGYTFAGWHTEKYGTGERIYDAAGAAVAGCSCWTSDKRWRRAADITLYAKWNPKNFTVTLMPGNGAASSSVTVTFSKDTNSNIASKTPTYAGHTFMGWWTSASGGEKVYDKNGLAVPNSTYWNASYGWRKAGSLTVYAHWSVPVGAAKPVASRAAADAFSAPASEEREPVVGFCHGGRYQDGTYVLIGDETGAFGHLVVECSELTLSADCAFVVSDDVVVVFVADDILYLEL